MRTQINNIQSASSAGKSGRQFAINLKLLKITLMDNDFKQCRELGTKIMSSLRFLPKPLLTFLSDAVTNEQQGLRTIYCGSR